MYIFGEKLRSDVAEATMLTERESAGTDNDQEGSRLPLLGGVKPEGITKCAQAGIKQLNLGCMGAGKPEYLIRIFMIQFFTGRNGSVVGEWVVVVTQGVPPGERRIPGARHSAQVDP